MLTWIRQQFSEFGFYLVAPILFHAKTDGVIMSTYFLLSEVTNGYGLLLIGLMFVSSLVLYRNKLLSVFNANLKTFLNYVSTVGENLTPFTYLRSALTRIVESIRKWFR